MEIEYSKSAPSPTVNDIGIIILAAGCSRRFNGDKRQTTLVNGKSLLENTLSKVPSSFTKRLLVLHPGDELLAQSFNSTWSVCIAQNAKEGMGASLASAILAVPHWQGAIIGLGDMPFIKPETYSMLQTQLTCKSITIPIYHGKRGNPVGFNAKYFTEIANLEGDRGARSLLEKHKKECNYYHCQDPGVLKDIDTKESLEKLKF